MPSVFVDLLSQTFYLDFNGIIQPFIISFKHLFMVDLLLFAKVTLLCFH